MGNRALTCVDGIHIKVQEPSPFSKDFSSHKYGKGSALAYELVSCIATGDIVAYNGPFPAGKWPDINIFRNKLKGMLGPGERCLADLGYRGDRKIITKNDRTSRLHAYAMGCARDRHETINRRVRQWGSLKQEFRHDRHDHHYFFRAAIVMEQIKMEHGEKPFQITNYIDPIPRVW